MATENTLRHSMDSALKHYSSMFFLPSYKKALLLVGVICIGIVGLSTFALFKNRLTDSLTLGLSLFIITIFLDIIMSKLIMKIDPIYILRRTLALSLFCWVLWGFFVILGVIFGALFGLSWWIKLCLLGFGAVLTLRIIVFVATSSTNIFRQLFFSPIFVLQFS